jgi:hypothetical protein
VLFRGTPTGLADGGQEVSQDTAGVLGAAEAGDGFGTAVALKDLNGDGLADLAAGVPGEDTAGIRDAGGVQIVDGAPAGLTAKGNRFVTQGAARVGARSEKGDAMGRTLAAGDLFGTPAAELAVGVPGEDIGRHSDAGAVVVLAGGGAPGSTLVTQDSPGVAGGPERGDVLGSALAIADLGGDGRGDLAVGVPGEALGHRTGAGLIHVIPGGDAALNLAASRAIDQDTPGVPGAAERGDAFGSAFGTADANGDGAVDLAAGSPGEKIGARRAAGSVTVLPSGNAAGARLIYQGSGASGRAETGDEYAGSGSAGG